MIKVNSDSSLFVLTVVYASPQFNKRKYMWQYLEDFVATTNRPLVLLGDFNDMLSEDKKLGGLLINPTRIRAFRNCLDNSGLRATASVHAKFLSILQKKKNIFFL